MSTPILNIHTDGGCLGNPGPGGWAAVLRYGARVKEISGGVPATTNNRMELQAAIEALSILKGPTELEMFTDSQYVRQGITAWIPKWKQRGWRTVDKQPVKNVDLWQTLEAQAQRHRITWRWLKGHAGHVDNERCDVLAGAAMAKVRREYSREELAEALRALRRQETGVPEAQLKF